MKNFYLVQMDVIYFNTGQGKLEFSHREKIIHRLLDDETAARELCSIPYETVENVLEYRYIVEIPLGAAGPYKTIAAYDSGGKEIDCGAFQS